MKKTYNGHCYCGKVKFQVSYDEGMPTRPIYCHCESCRRAHSSPLYQIVYVKADRFRFLEGEERVKTFSHRDDFTRDFCGNCGSRVRNVLIKSQSDPLWDNSIGFFPALLEEHDQHNLLDPFKPKAHYYAEETVFSDNVFSCLLETQ
mmetsp:Transcript_13847/g.18084  ORF Transcript_13847/g.18084 Transcript_13847/m.18084 type:complete len:147 (+) Transcript_13847:2028-2468(+)